MSLTHDAVEHRLRPRGHPPPAPGPRTARTDEHPDRRPHRDHPRRHHAQHRRGQQHLRGHHARGVDHVVVAALDVVGGTSTAALMTLASVAYAMSLNAMAEDPVTAPGAKRHTEPRSSRAACPSEC